MTVFEAEKILTEEIEKYLPKDVKPIYKTAV